MIRLPDRLEPNFLLQAYAVGIFPMADDEGRLSWYSPDPRAILEHDDLRVSRSLKSLMRKGTYVIRFDTAFERVMRECAGPRIDEQGTWITEEFIDTYSVLHRYGFAHSVEAWHDDVLVGGLYGVAIGAAFMGESMFSRMPNASKACLVALVERLQRHGYQLHDTQFLTPHLERLGAKLISRDEYTRRLEQAVQESCSFR
jgi:leucyl/phenylalanyl-tRNA--protein transferase